MYWYLEIKIKITILDKWTLEYYVGSAAIEMGGFGISGRTWDDLLGQ